jgi:GNAT superfamily N-acetyltransferase
LTRGGAAYALIENVVTDAQHRNRGYGQAILKAAVAAAWECGCYKALAFDGFEKRGNSEVLSAGGLRAEQDRISNATASKP